MSAAPAGPAPSQAALPSCSCLSAPVAVLLQEEYCMLEAAYLGGLNTAFAQLRVAQERRLRHFANQRTAFDIHLRRPAPDKGKQVPHVHFCACASAVHSFRGAFALSASLVLKLEKALSATTPCVSEEMLKRTSDAPTKKKIGAGSGLHHCLAISRRRCTQSCRNTGGAGTALS